jgi:hypothetical protein
MAKQQYINLVTPLGKARYPKLAKQDVYEGKEVGYKCGITFDDEKVQAKFEAQVEEAIRTLLPTVGRKGPKFSPMREDRDGNTYFEFKSYKKVPLFGAKASEKLPEETVVGGGSVVRLKVSLTASNGGVTGYMNAIQVAKLEQGGGDGFDDLEGYDDDQGSDEGFSDVSGEALDI